MFIRYLVFSLALLFASNIHANEDERSPTEKCKMYSKHAESVMGVRQMGLPMSEAMDAAEDSELLRKFVISAYKEPRWNTEEHQARAIVEFADKAYLECAEIMFDQ